MSRIGSDPNMQADSSPGWRFPLRPVGLDEAGQLLRESLAPYRAAPLRLIGLFVLLMIPILMLNTVPGLGPVLFNVAEAVAFVGYTCALDAAARSEAPDLRHLGVVLRLDHVKLILLVVTGLLPYLAAVLASYGIWGVAETTNFLAERAREKGHPSPAMELGFRAVSYIVNMPLTFVTPVWALYRWSGSRSMAANLLASWVNWRWVLCLTAFGALTDSVLDWMLGLGDSMKLPTLVVLFAVYMLTLSWTLALAKRSLPPR